MKSKINLILGASNNPNRYSKMAIQLLQNRGEDIIAVGAKEAIIGSTEIVKHLPAHINEVHTITIYLKPSNQKPYEEIILNLKPKRVIFNPGAGNPPFEQKLKSLGIEVLNACTLVMIQTNQY